MLTATTGHPSAESLRAFALGRLGDEESAAIEEHLASCAECQQVVEDTPVDSLVETLREPAPAAAGKSAGPQPGLFARLAGILHPSAPQVAVGPPARCHEDVPPELRDHPRYETLEWLGAGGMGTVFKARHRLMDRIVALKVMNPKLLADPVAVARFQREVKAAAQLAHPHIVTAYDAEQVGDLHFMAMEYVEGQTLADVVDQRGTLPVHLACDYVRQAALGLQCAHERGTVHRDIKPQNLVLTPTGHVKVFDFGLARFVSESGEPAGSGTPGTETAFGKLMGSPDYMAPEQAKDAHSADIRADIYSLGCTLYHLLAGLPPFPGGSAVEKISAHLEKVPLAVARVRPGVPPGVQAVLDRMLAKDPAQRFQTPAEVAAALEPLCQPAPVTPPTRSSLAPVLRGEGWGEGWKRLRQSYRSVGTWAAAVALLLALGAGGVFFAPAVYRFATNRGTLVIETDDADVEVIVKQGGEQVRIIDTKTRREVTLKAGQYQLELADGKEGLQLSASDFSLSRGGKEIVRVWLEKKEPAPLPKQEPKKELPPAFPPPIEPLPLAELLKGREVLTVAQDGSGMFKTIGAAVDALKPRQVVMILDKGPYRERFVKTVPDDVGIVSSSGTHIELPDLGKDSASNYWGILLTCPQGVRLSGIEVVCPGFPSDAKIAGALVLQAAGCTIIDHCRILPTPRSSMEKPERGPCAFRAITFQGYLQEPNRPSWLVVDGNHLDGIVICEGESAERVLFQHNHFVGGSWYPLSIPGIPREVVIRRNVFHTFDGIHCFIRAESAPQGTEGRYTIVNNYFDTVAPPIMFRHFGPELKNTYRVPRSVQIQNNVFRSRAPGGQQMGIWLETEGELAVAKASWQVGHNCYLVEPQSGPGQTMFPRQATDLIEASPIVSANPADADFLRIGRHSSLATAGAGGDLPKYIGALPPGPAPKEGDWFTRLQGSLDLAAPPSAVVAKPLDQPAPKTPPAKPPEPTKPSPLEILELRCFAGHRLAVLSVAF